ncbi:oxidative stress-responsive serine-rich protein 1 isoform X2 [Ambystoma mexicanum]|uniref:oxidative stress-responsive serine-rich protein 1 isoform X2 n=1 Tax=Ambystoma mexicanum TaxID=8296 RepID=UPI0037E8C3A3
MVTEKEAYEVNCIIVERAKDFFNNCGLWLKSTNMEPEAKDGEEENLQTAFKKLRVDAERSAVSLCEGTNRTSIRNVEDAKAKVICASKENWHGSTRKTSRGASRTQRRRRSKSPILHPPKFTHCTTKTPASNTLLKHKSQLETLDGNGNLGNPANKESLSTLNIAASGGFNEHPKKSAAGPTSDIDTAQQNHPANPLVSESSLKASQPSDFRLVSKTTGIKNCTCKGKECQCKNWQNMEVYSFSGLRNIISECEKTAIEDYPQSLQNRIQVSSTGTSGSPRSCSEQARASVDDVTIEDLSGYMEYYFYIPKEMSYMAEMMYT